MNGVLSRIGLVLILGAIGCLPDDRAGEAPAPVAEAPRFEDFPVKTIYKGKPLPVNLLSHPKALRYKERLVEGAKAGPNFAGRYTVVRWGCGPECQQAVVVDARTGGVVMAPFLTRLGFRFRLDSRLFVANPPEAVQRALRHGEVKTRYKSVYYVWHNGRFVAVYSVRH